VPTTASASPIPAGDFKSDGNVVGYDSVDALASFIFVPADCTVSFIRAPVAFFCTPLYATVITAASIPITTITTRSSTIVKPFSRVLLRGMFILCYLVTVTVDHGL